jgi:hypothetical protein
MLKKKTYSYHILFIVALLAILSVSVFAVSSASANRPDFCDEPEFANLPECVYGVPEEGSSQESYDTRNIDADCSEENRPNSNKEALHPDNCAIMNYIRIITDGLTVLVGVVVTGMLVFGGIQYSAAGSNPQMVQAAKKHISQALLALAIWIFMAAFLQWLVPGGIF